MIWTLRMTQYFTNTGMNVVNHDRWCIHSRNGWNRSLDLEGPHIWFWVHTRTIHQRQTGQEQHLLLPRHGTKRRDIDSHGIDTEPRCTSDQRLYMYTHTRMYIVAKKRGCEKTMWTKSHKLYSLTKIEFASLGFREIKDSAVWYVRWLLVAKWQVKKWQSATHVKYVSIFCCGTEAPPTPYFPS